MIYSIITLLIVALILFILSFFMNDKFKQLENQLEQVSLSTLQDSYQLKKKIKILEEELLTNDMDISSLNKTPAKTPLITKVEKLYQQGKTVDVIAKATNLSEYDVHSIIKQFSYKG